MALSDDVDAKRKEIQTDGYPSSISELATMYRDGELDIHPEFQRQFRWTLWQKSRLIESLLLGIPLPSIFVAQRKDGVWDVIDGLQRLSTIFEFMGILKDDKGVVQPPLVLEATKMLPTLQGVVWEEPNEAKGQSLLPSHLQLIIKRSKVDMKIVLRESDENSKYELFQRLNTGGSALTDQELRNCMVMMVNRPFYDWLSTLPEVPEFQRSILLSERARSEGYDLELISRWLVFRRAGQEQLVKLKELKEFVDDELVKLAMDPSFDKGAELDAFRWTFGQIANSLGENAFRKYDIKTEKHVGAMLISAFEGVAIGLGSQYENRNDGKDRSNVVARMINLWSDSEFSRYIGSGVSPSYRVPRTVAAGRRAFS